jgi:hypothetical protein
MIPKTGYRFSACAKPRQRPSVRVEASAGEGRSEKIMLKQQAKARWRFNLIPFRFGHTSRKPAEKTRLQGGLNLPVATVNFSPRRCDDNATDII